MTTIETLPLLVGAKLIVLDEGANAMYARKLIAGWIQMYRDRDPSRIFDLLLFSDPKSTYQSEPEHYMLNNVNIYDYYTVDINGLDINAICEKDFNSLEYILKTINTKSTVIIDCLTSLILFVGLSKTLWFLETLSKQVPQVICIYRRDFAQNKVPCIGTLGSTYVNIQKFNGAQMNKNFYFVVEYVHRKVGGGILKQQELVNQSSTTYEIQSVKVEQNRKSDVSCMTYKEKIESSFRIEISEDEMKQRKGTILPYMVNSNTTNTSKIHYEPETIDDIDEEDPDDDLCF